MNKDIQLKIKLKDLMKEFSHLPIRFMVSNDLASDYDYTLHRIQYVEHTLIMETDDKVFIGESEIEDELTEIYEREVTIDEIMKNSYECIVVYTST